LRRKKFGEVEYALKGLISLLRLPNTNWQSRCLSFAKTIAFAKELAEFIKTELKKGD